MAAKYCCHNEGKLILRAFFARSPDGSAVSFRYTFLRGDTVMPSGLLARLCHEFLVFLFLKMAAATILDYQIC